MPFALPILATASKLVKTPCRAANSRKTHPTLLIFAKNGQGRTWVKNDEFHRFQFSWERQVEFARYGFESAFRRAGHEDPFRADIPRPSLVRKVRMPVGSNVPPFGTRWHETDKPPWCVNRQNLVHFRQALSVLNSANIQCKLSSTPASFGRRWLTQKRHRRRIRYGSDRKI